MMNLTLRQRVFLKRFIELYQKEGEPIHYSRVARCLGLSNSTAYDMLRLLGQKGLVNSQYLLPKPSSGPGRSSILFFPIEAAMSLFSHLARGATDQQEWREVKAYIMESLRQERPLENGVLLRKLLDSIPKARSPLVISAEVITALLLGLRRAELRLGKESPINVLLEGPISKIGMSMLVGFAFSLYLTDQAGRKLLSNFESYVRRCESALQELSEESLMALHRFTWDVWEALKATTGR
ncbi:MAG: hypothetical protein KAW00_07360 [Dehalococcoidia bacterium]|nr:hypothetical protein [Dehalococcoidia bacterium]